MRLRNSGSRPAPDYAHDAFGGQRMSPAFTLPRGLKALEAEDAGVFSGRDAEMIDALNQLRGFNQAPGFSSFLAHNSGFVCH